MKKSHKSDFEFLEELMPNHHVSSKTFVLVQDFTDQSYAKFLVDFEMVRENMQHIVPIVVDSYGGSVETLNGMLSVIRSSDVPVMTIVNSKAMSAGAVLAASGTKGLRYFSPLARGMIHSISSGAQDKLLGLQLTVKEVAALNKQMFGLLDQYSGKPKDFFFKLLEKNSDGDLYYSGKKAKSWGLADHVGVPLIRSDKKVINEIQVIKAEI